MANVSHELKTPLSSIKGSAEILIDGIITDRVKRKEYLQIIFNEATRLSDLVNEILQLAELDTMNFSLDVEQINVRDFLQNIKSIFSKRLKQNREIFKINVPNIPLYIQGDREKLKQVLLNLLDNAYKFSSVGSSVTVGVEIEGDRVKFWVKDKGQGIKADQLDDVWKRFFKVDQARTPGKKAGSGLGLAIIKQIINQHGGEVFVESEYNSGSIFGFYLVDYQVNDFK
ncbi:sensor histidine kinase [Halanaerobaculum tunisiense]